jgi:hypothetical protein
MCYTDLENDETSHSTSPNNNRQTQRSQKVNFARDLLLVRDDDVYTAMLVKAEVGTIDRFPNCKTLASGAGLAP